MEAKKNKTRVQKPKKEKKVKVRKPRKMMSVKQKLIISFSLILIIISTIVGVGSVFVKNDFAMTTIFSKDVEKSFRIVDEVIQTSFDARYLDIHIFTELRTIGSSTAYYTSDTSMKAIKYDDDSYGYVATSQNLNTTIEQYYREGILYMKNGEMKGKSAVSSAQSTFQNFIMPFLPGNYIFQTTSGTFAERNEFSTMKTTLIFNSKPLYFGEKFEFEYNTLEREKYILDFNGNLKQKSYFCHYNNDANGPIITLIITYNSINEMFELEYPYDLNTY